MAKSVFSERYVIVAPDVTAHEWNKAFLLGRFPGGNLEGYTRVIDDQNLTIILERVDVEWEPPPETQE